MLKLIKAVKKSVAKTVANNVADFKATYNASVAMKSDFMGMGYKHIDTVDGIKVYLNDNAVTVTVGSNRSANAIATTAGDGEAVIVVNQKLLDSGIYDAIIQHEIGHHVNQHKRPKTYIIDLVLGRGKGLDIEYEADAYAHSKGADILGALRVLQKELPGKAIAKRIARLESLSN